jgi:hypothetical protein
MTTPTSSTSQHTQPHRVRSGTDDPVTAAARHLYDAERALHDAHQSHVDAWITAAADRLHDALVEHMHALAASHHSGGRR